MSFSYVLDYFAPDAEEGSFHGHLPQLPQFVGKVVLFVQPATDDEAQSAGYIVWLDLLNFCWTFYWSSACGIKGSHDPLELEMHYAEEAY